MMKRWQRLPRAAVAAPSLAVFKARLDRALSTLGQWKGSLPMAEDWNEMVCKVPSNPSHLVILCLRNKDRGEYMLLSSNTALGSVRARQERQAVAEGGHSSYETVLPPDPRRGCSSSWGCVSSPALQQPATVCLRLARRALRVAFCLASDSPL